MTRRHTLGMALTATLALSLWAAAPFAIGRDASAGPGLTSSRVTIAGTSNIHAYTASTTAARVTRMQLAADVRLDHLWDDAVKPGAVEAFELVIPAATLVSGNDGLDKNMHKALKTTEHREIVFRLGRLEPAAAADARRAHGTLTVAGVERDVVVDVTLRSRDAGLALTGTTELLMTHYGIVPPKAMLGMLKTNPKVTVTFEFVLGTPLT